MTSPGTRARHSPILRVALLAALFVATLPILTPAAEEIETGELEIAISGLETDRGVLVVALLNSAASFENESKAFRSDKLVVKDGRARANFRNLPYGSYAVKTFHDENSNGKLDTNLVGFPTEAFGFSNDAMGRFGPPSFEAAKFELASGELRIEIHSN